MSEIENALAWADHKKAAIVPAHTLAAEVRRLRAELAAAQEELESIQPDTDEHRTIADSIAGHRKWASATEKCERMCLEKAEKAEAERDSLLAQVKVKDEALRQCQDEMAAKGMNTAACDVGLAALSPEPEKPAPGVKP